jgi:cephalosporin hydroxylase
MPARGTVSVTRMDLDEGFARAFWQNKQTTFVPNRWLGIPCWQNPFDVWNIQEIIAETRPDTIVETGTFSGGGAALWASLLAMFGDGRVISVDVNPPLDPAVHELPIVQQRVRFVTGSSTDPDVVEDVAAACQGRTMVILDSDHRASHVRTELDTWSPFVTPGCYLVVQDGIVTYIAPELTPGPLEAIQEWIPGRTDFVVDESRERMGFTFCVSGFLRRVEAA